MQEGINHQIWSHFLNHIKYLPTCVCMSIGEKVCCLNIYKENYLLWYNIHFSCYKVYGDAVLYYNAYLQFATLQISLVETHIRLMQIVCVTSFHIHFIHIHYMVKRKKEKGLNTYVNLIFHF